MIARPRDGNEIDAKVGDPDPCTISCIICGGPGGSICWSCGIEHGFWYL